MNLWENLDWDPSDSSEVRLKRWAQVGEFGVWPVSVSSVCSVVVHGWAYERLGMSVKSAFDERFESVRSRGRVAERHSPGDRWTGVPAFAGHGLRRGSGCDWSVEEIGQRVRRDVISDWEVTKS